MGIAVLPYNITLLAILAENAFTLGKLQAHPLAAPFTAQFDNFQQTWSAANATRISLLIALDKAEGAVSAADDAIDDFVDTLDRTVLIATKNDRSSQLYQFYFGTTPPYKLKRPVLGDELVTLKSFIPSLQASPNPALVALAPTLIGLCNNADAAVASRLAAEEALKDFDEIGGKKTLIDTYNALRQNVYGQLAAIPHQNPSAMLPNDFADRFFQHHAHKGLSAMTNPKEVQARIDALQKELTAAQDRLAEIENAAKIKAQADADAKIAADKAAQAKKAAKDAEEAAKEAEAEAKAAKKKAKKAKV